MTGYPWIGNDHVVSHCHQPRGYRLRPDGFPALGCFDVETGVNPFRRLGGGREQTRRRIFISITTPANIYSSVMLLAEATNGWDFPEVVEVDVKTGKYSMVQRVNPVVRSWAVDGQGNVRAGFNRDRDNGKVRMLYTARRAIAI